MRVSKRHRSLRVNPATTTSSDVKNTLGRACKNQAGGRSNHSHFVVTFKTTCQGDTMNFWLIPILLFVPVAQSAHSPDAVVERLAKTGVFAFGRVGYAGIISPGETDYRTVFNRSSAKADFEKLYSTGNLQAKC